MLVFWVLIISRLDSQSKFQMFTLFSSRHIGVPRRYTNMAFSYWALRNNSTNFWSLGRHTGLKLGEVSYLFIYLFICLFIYVFIYLFISLSLSFFLSFFLSFSLSFFLSFFLYFFIYLSSIASLFLSLFRWVVFDLCFYCVTVKPMIWLNLKR